jgi:hypothetical protein
VTIGRDLLEIAPDVIPGSGRNRVVIASGAKQSRVKRENWIASSLALLAMTLMKRFTGCSAFARFRGA